VTYEDAAHLVEHPVAGSRDALEVLLGTTRLEEKPLNPTTNIAEKLI